MSKVTDKAIGGWIKDFEVKEYKQYSTLDGVKLETLRNKYIEYFEDYRTRYFYDKIVSGQGLEELLFTLQKYSGVPSRWIDLGAGVVTLLWSLPVNTSKIKAIEVCDLVPEALYVLKRFVNSKEIPPCYLDVLDYVKKDETTIENNRTLSWEYHIFNCLKEWPDVFSSKSYDLITAIGCFGLSDNKREYTKSFNYAIKHLSSEGYIIGADWIRSEKFIREESHDNSYLSTNFILSCASKNELGILKIEHIKIEGDPYYDSIIIWAFYQK